MASTDSQDASIVSAQLFSAEQAWHHIQVECLGVIDDIVDTLRAEGPYAYTISPNFDFDGNVPTQLIANTREGVGAAYTAMHERTNVTGMIALTEIRTDWYTYMCGIGSTKSLATGQTFDVPVSIIFPNHGGVGISGELIWRPTQPSRLGDDSNIPLAGEFEIYNLTESFLDAVRKGDIDALVEMSVPDVQTMVRDYVSEDGNVTVLHSAEELRSYLEAFYTKFAVRRVELLHRHLENWLAFTELHWEVELLTGPNRGSTATFRTAEQAEFGADRRITARIGHGTAVTVHNTHQ